MTNIVLRTAAAALFSIATVAHADTANDWIANLSTAHVATFPAASAEASNTIPGSAWLSALSTSGNRHYPGEDWAIAANDDSSGRWIAALSTVKAPQATVKITQVAAVGTTANSRGAN